MSRVWTERAEFLVDHLDLPAATGVENAAWEYFQLAHLNDDGPFRIEVKSRQIAWSWLSAAEGLADAILTGRSSIYVSINQREAQEKIRYAKAAIAALTPSVRPRLVAESRGEIELANGARLISLPAQAPRGFAQFNLFYDEFAHVRDDQAIYTGGLPVTSKGGRLRMGSSPLGASGVFWEIAEEKLRKYPGYTRSVTPWWHASSFCTDVRTARRVAPQLTTAQRVERFGNIRIQVIYANLPEEDFQQEYECIFVDETTAWITWEEIRSAQDQALVCVTAEGLDGNIDDVLLAIAEFQDLITAGSVEAVFAGGVDVGRTRNTTEIFLVGLTTLASYPLRMTLTLDNCSFEQQLDVLLAVMAHIPVTTLLIDQNGIGRNLAENMASRYPGKAAGMNFTNPTKTLWATDVKMLIQQRRTPLPPDRDLAYQIHSIKKTVTAARNLIFDTARNEKHHADKFWAWALALNAAIEPLPAPDSIVVQDDRVHISSY